MEVLEEAPPLPKTRYDLSMNLLYVFLLPALLQSGSSITVPDGHVLEPYLTAPGTVSVRFDRDGKLLVGALGAVYKENAPGRWDTVATGVLLATAVARTEDDTLYVGDTGWVSQGVANLWAVPPGEVQAQVAVTRFRYCQGLLALPGGDVLAVDAGFLGAPAGDDGRVLRIPPGTRDADSFDFPVVFQTPLKNPVGAEFGPDGKIYVLDRGHLDVQPGKLMRFTLGDAEAETVLDGLNDPFDLAWMPDGSLLITDTLGGIGSVLRYVPSTGALDLWASGFPAPHGIEAGPNGDVYIADIFGVVYRVRPLIVSTAVPMSLEPETLNPRSQGQSILAKVTSGPEPVSGIRITAVDGNPIAHLPALRVMQKPDGFHAEFDRSLVLAHLTSGTRRVRLEGTWPGGRPFHSETDLRVLD